LIGKKSESPIGFFPVELEFFSRTGHSPWMLISVY
jgi:hypothetical protein